MYPAEEEGVEDIGHRHFIRPCGGWWMWWHDCPAPAAGNGHISWWWFGNDGTQASGHVIESTEPLTVGGSLLCTDCGDHGFIRDGRWVPV